MVREHLPALFPKAFTHPLPQTAPSGLPPLIFFTGLTHKVPCLWQSPLTWGQSGRER